MRKLKKTWFQTDYFAIRLLIPAKNIICSINDSRYSVYTVQVEEKQLDHFSGSSNSWPELLNAKCDQYRLQTMQNNMKTTVFWSAILLWFNILL